MLSSLGGGFGKGGPPPKKAKKRSEPKADSATPPSSEARRESAVTIPKPAAAAAAASSPPASASPTLGPAKSADDLETIRRRAAVESAPGGRQEALLKSLGVKGIEDDPAFRNGITPTPGEESVVTLFDVVPMGAQKVVEQALVAGFVGSLLFFIGTGIAIALEAFSVASKTPLTEGVSQVVLTVEPYFTPSLLVVFGFSITLGLLKIGQSQRAGAKYRE
ncbi:unnamed protein product [Phaeothamnion confervicola]